MAKPEWGTKRQCETCEAKFYDLGKSPIVCPDCGAEFKVVVAARPAPKPEVKEVKSPPKPDRRKRAPEGQDAGEDDGVDLDEDENDATLDDVVDSGKTE